MSTLFNRCISIILRSEGGFQNNPHDPGNYVDGKLVGTKYGIAAKFFPTEDIENLTLLRAAQLYKTHYWNPMNLEGINSDPLVLQIFDFGVNAGKRTSIKAIQGIVGVTKDGICGPITKAHINSFKCIEKNDREYCAFDLFKDYRKRYYTNLANRKPEMKIFLNGWLSRVENTHFL